jgi:antirestriction protein ArdC
MASRDWPAKNLQNLERIGRLRAEPVDGGEVLRYLASADRFLADARNNTNNVATRFITAYSAAHALAVAALRANDYRTAQEKGHRRLVFEALPHSCGAETADALALVRAHEKRNAVEYEAMAEITEREVGDLVGIAARLRDSLQAWLKRHRPELVKKK